MAHTENGSPMHRRYSNYESEVDVIACTIFQLSTEYPDTMLTHRGFRESVRQSHKEGDDTLAAVVAALCAVFRNTIETMPLYTRGCASAEIRLVLNHPAFAGVPVDECLSLSPFTRRAWRLRNFAEKVLPKVPDALKQFEDAVIKALPPTSVMFDFATAQMLSE